MSIYKTVKQSLNRGDIRDAFDALKTARLHPQERYDPSLSGMTMGVFRVQVPEEEERLAIQILRGNCPRCRTAPASDRPAGPYFGLCDDCYTDQRAEDEDREDPHAGNARCPPRE